MQVIFTFLFLYSEQQPNNNPVTGTLTYLNTKDKKHGNSKRSDNSYNVTDEEHNENKKNSKETNVMIENRFGNADHNKMSKLDRWRNGLTCKMVILPSKMEGNLVSINPSIDENVRTILESYKQWFNFLEWFIQTKEPVVHRAYCRWGDQTPVEKKFLRSVRRGLKNTAEKFKSKHNGLTPDEVWPKIMNYTGENIVFDLDAMHDIAGHIMNEARVIYKLVQKKKYRFPDLGSRYYAAFGMRMQHCNMTRITITEARKKLTNLKFFDSSTNTGVCEIESTAISPWTSTNDLSLIWNRYKGIMAHIGSRYDNERTPLLSFASFSADTGYKPRNSSLQLESFWSNCSMNRRNVYHSPDKLVDTQQGAYNWLSNLREHANNNPEAAFTIISMAVIGSVALTGIVFKKFTRRKQKYDSVEQVNDV